MKKVNVNLVQSSEGLNAAIPGSPEPRYPTAHFEGPEELPVPDHGTMVVHYRLRNEVERTDMGKEWYSCDIEIHRIISAEAEKEDESPTRRDTSTEDALDRLMEERQPDEEKE